MRSLLFVLLGFTAVLNAKPVKLVNVETVKLEVANWNTWLMCTLPEVWKADDHKAVLDKAADSDLPEERWVFSVYVRNWYALMDDYYSDEPDYEQLITSNEGSLSAKYRRIVNSLNDEERNATLVTDCNDDWGKILLEKRKQLGYQD